MSVFESASMPESQEEVAKNRRLALTVNFLYVYGIINYGGSICSPSILITTIRQTSIESGVQVISNNDGQLEVTCR